jgi:hypothetical protein
MAYVDPDFQTKKEFISAVKNGQQLRPYNPSGMFPQKQDGNETIEGPHYPKPHKWYASVVLKDGVIVKVN